MWLPVRGNLDSRVDQQAFGKHRTFMETPRGLRGKLGFQARLCQPPAVASASHTTCLCLCFPICGLGLLSCCVYGEAGWRRQIREGASMQMRKMQGNK